MARTRLSTSLSFYIAAKETPRASGFSNPVRLSLAQHLTAWQIDQPIYLALLASWRTSLQYIFHLGLECLASAGAPAVSIQYRHLHLRSQPKLWMA